MPEFVLERTQLVPRPLEETFAFFADARNLEAITPPWLHFRILELPESLEGGALLRYRISLGGIPIGWRTRIDDWRPPRSFTDRQLRGPYLLWEHTHRFRGVEGIEMYDHVRYRIAGGPLAPLVQRLLVGRLLSEIFDHRAQRLAELLVSNG
ncbi:MAG: SRPBCC family protein [Gaiellaceae bacterium]